MGLQDRSLILDARTVKLLCLGLLGLVIIFVCMLFVEASSMENQLHSRVTEQVSKGGFERISVSISGRDVILDGAVSSVEARQRIEEFVKGADGVRAIRTNVGRAAFAGKCAGIATVSGVRPRD